MVAVQGPDLPEAGALARLGSVLAAARDAGFLGPGNVAAQLHRSLALVQVVVEAVGTRPAHSNGDDVVRALDLGSGGGLPGLVLASVLPHWRWTLLDGSVRRTAWLREAVDTLELDAVDVVAERAELSGHGPLRASQDLVVARSFAGPAATAECGAGLLRLGGALVVTEPPGGSPERWDDAGLALLGLRSSPTPDAAVAVHVARAVAGCPDRYPRRVGIPVKRPLW